MDIPQLLSDLITEETKIISCKINYAEGEYQDGILEPPDEIHLVASYLKDCKVDILYSTCGLHLNGENKKPHIHWHMIVKNLPNGSFITNNSQHRKRWLAKEGTDGFFGVSFRFPKKENPVWQVLSYPYKEGLVTKCCQKVLDVHNKLPSQEIKDFLLQYGNTLYQTQLGNNARKDACEERQKKALNDLRRICEDAKDQFSSYNEMILWLDDNYIAKLQLEDYPEPMRYKSNCQKIAVFLGKLKYSHII